MTVAPWAALALALIAAPRAAAAADPSPSPSPSPHAASAGGVGQPPYAPEVKLDRFEWEKAVDGETPIRALRVFNDYGDIRARFAGDRNAAVSAVIQRLGESGVGVTVERRGDVVAIHVAYPPGRRQDADPQPPKGAHDRADLVVFVPEGVSLEAHTFRGMFEARKLKSDVHASTRDGSIFALTTGAVTARSDSGVITVFIGPSAPGTAPLVLESRSGAIEVTLPQQGGDYDVRAETGGAIETDLPLTRTQRAARHVATGAVGAGGRALIVSSAAGPVAVLRWPGR
jgi:hypothetical protein